MGERESEEPVEDFDDIYRDIAQSCFRYLDFKSFAEVDRLTIPEYNMLMEAVRLKQVDLDYRTHLLAWLTFAAKATKGKGKNIKPVYKNFKLFFNYEDALENAKKPAGETGKKARFAGIGQFFKKGE